MSSTSITTLSLAGKWRLELDPHNVGETEKWYLRELSGSISLPGTLDLAGIGNPNPDRCPARLNRKVTYLGVAWYSREIEISEDWSAGFCEISLERALWKTTVWIEDQLLGSCDSLSAPHIYTFLSKPGKHKLTVRVDNSRQNNICGHAYSDMQTIWNGLIGNLSLTYRAHVYCEDVQVFTELRNNSVEAKLCINNNAGQRVSSYVRLHILTSDEKVVAQTDSLFMAEFGVTNLVLILNLGHDAIHWSEFSPELYTLKIAIESPVGTDVRSVRFGMRKFSFDGTQFTINDQRTFLRGEHDAGGNSLLGHPPIELSDWRRIFTIGREWGMNHWRFHSWCPPKAAFQAADEIGIYLQPELPLNGDIPVDVETQIYLAEELRRIIRCYGNHPSFVLFSNGNELRGDVNFLRSLTTLGQKSDSRRLWAMGTNAPWEHPTVPSSDDPEDFFVGSMTKNFDPKGINQDQLLRGSYHWHTMGHINNASPSTKTDYREAVSKCSVPAISHEVGQYCSYPNFTEINKYNGVLEPRNYELIRESVAKNQLLEQAESFHQASGQLVWRLYKEEIEAALRTRGMAGFQLLDLRDFQDQGTAIVGLLDSFWDNKCYLKSEQFRQFCGPIVPLLRMEKLTWSHDEILEAQVEVAHYGEHDYSQALISWSISNTKGVTMNNGLLSECDIQKGGLRSIGSISVSLKKFISPEKYRITLNLVNTSICNSWDFWVYPDNVDTTTPDNVLVTTNWGETLEALKTEACVLFLVTPETTTCSVEGAFQSDFWCYAMFQQFTPPGTLGLICDPSHPALAGFPTDMHADWQWWDLLKHSRSLILNTTPKELKPIVQMIDTYGRNHKLGNLFEARVGTSRLLVCSIDLTTNLEKRIVARQFRRSILDYMRSPKFSPQQELSVEVLNALFTPELQSTNSEKYQICLHVRDGQVITRKSGFDSLLSSSTVLTGKCPPSFNGFLRVCVNGSGLAKLHFLHHEEGSVTLDREEKWVEFSTVQRAWKGELPFEIKSTPGDKAMITEWMIVE